MLLLLPVSLLFFCLSSLRRWLYRVGIKSTHKLPVPIIVVGNISVGGNGKTPLVILLAKWLDEAGYKPGVLSRGYGGKAAEYPLSVEAKSLPDDVGDEPVLMRQNLSCPMVVDPKRPRGAAHLISQYGCNVIICDDGLQHYALARDLELIVMDGERRLGNGLLLPAGPLREGAWRLSSTEFVICNGGTAKQDEYKMTLEPTDLVNVKDPARTRPLSSLVEPVVAAAGIGNPQRFFDFLLARQVRFSECLSFPDHHQFSQQDLPDTTVIMTEKDAVKCQQIAQDEWWYLPVTAALSDKFKQQILTRLASVQKTEGNHGI